MKELIDDICNPPFVPYGQKIWPMSDACKSCSNHPYNGGSGVCNCTLGTPQVKC